MNKDNLIQMLKEHEGSVTNAQGRHIAYEDTVGVVTVGYGRNLDERGLTEDEALMLLENDIEDYWNRLVERHPVVSTLSCKRQEALADMAFNLGIEGIDHFKRMWSAIDKEDFDKAAKEMLDSKWARQVGYRAEELAEMMRGG